MRPGHKSKVVEQKHIFTVFYLWQTGPPLQLLSDRSSDIFLKFFGGAVCESANVRVSCSEHFAERFLPSPFSDLRVIPWENATGQCSRSRCRPRCQLRKKTSTFGDNGRQGRLQDEMTKGAVENCEGAHVTPRPHTSHICKTYLRVPSVQNEGARQASAPS